MVVEILFEEVCGLYGDGQNVNFLQATLPQAQFVRTALTDEPYFAEHTPDLIYIGSMIERIQRRGIEKLRPYTARLEELVEKDVPILATGNAGEIFCKHITYKTEETEIDGLGLVDLTVETDYFNRYNGKVLADFEGMEIVGFRSQFSFMQGDNSQNYFLQVRRGDGLNKKSKLEGFRVHNLIGTNLLGPILALNPLFCEYFVGLSGAQAEAAYKDEAMDAYRQRVKEFSDPEVKF